jgi:hypothetical protein
MLGTPGGASRYLARKRPKKSTTAFGLGYLGYFYSRKAFF